MRPTMWDAFFWQGLMLVSRGQVEGIQDVERALQLGMFPVLLAPLNHIAAVSSNEAVKEALSSFSLPSVQQEDV
jgi:hypothetical protein